MFPFLATFRGIGRTGRSKDFAGQMKRGMGWRQLSIDQRKQEEGSSPETQRVDGIENEKESRQPLLVLGERKFPCLPTVLNGAEGGKRELFFFDTDTDSDGPKMGDCWDEYDAFLLYHRRLKKTNWNGSGYVCGRKQKPCVQVQFDQVR